MLSFISLTLTRICRYMVGEDGEENVPHRVWFQIYERVLNEVKEELKKQGREDEFVGSKVIVLPLFPPVPIYRSTLTSCLYFRSFTRPCAMSPAKSSSGISKTVSRSSRSARTWSQASTSLGMRTRSSRSSTTRSRSSSLWNGKKSSACTSPSSSMRERRSGMAALRT